MLVEQIDFSILFRWFVGLTLNEPMWDVTSFTKNRDRLLAGEIAAEFFAAVVAQARKLSLLSDERFTVDGTLIEAWASEKSYREKPGPPPSKGSGVDGMVLKSNVYESVTDPDARMYRKGLKTGWKLRQAGIAMLRRLSRIATPKVVMADKGYHEQDFVEAVLQMVAEAHVPPYARRRQRCWVDRAIYTQLEYGVSQKKRKWIERFFGWLKNAAQLRKTRHRGHPKLDWNLALAAAAYNLVRIVNPTPAG